MGLGMGMGLGKAMGIFTIIPATLLLTVSFFVLFALSKTEKSALRIFGMCIAVLLWISAAIVFSTGMLVAYKSYNGYHGWNKAGICPFALKDYHSGMADPREGMMKVPYHNRVNTDTVAPEAEK